MKFPLDRVQLPAGLALPGTHNNALLIGLPGHAGAGIADLIALAAAMLAALAASHAARRAFRPAPVTGAAEPDAGRMPADAASREPVESRFWRFIALGLFFWAAGQLFFIYNHDFRHGAVSALNAQHLLFFLFGVPLALALFLNEAGDEGLSGLASRFDFLQVIVVSLFAYLEFFVLPGLYASAARAQEHPSFSIYNLENILLFAGYLLRGCATRNPRLRTPLLRMSVFLGVYAAVAAAVYPLQGQAAWAGLAWTAPFLLLGGLIRWIPAKLPAAGTQDEESESRAGLGWLLAALAPLLITRFYLLRYVQWRGRPGMDIAVVASAACFLLYIARQAVVQVMLIRARSAMRMEFLQRQRFEAALRQAQRQEAVGRLAGGVAHDFNNLLTIIQGQCELLLHEIKDGKVQRRMETALQASQSAAGLVRQLLAFGRQQASSPRPLDLNQKIESLLPLLRGAAGNQAALRWQAAAEPVNIQADPAQLEQILLNLIINARDAIEDSGEIRMATGVIVLSAEAAERLQLPPGQYAQLVIGDNGRGIAPEVLPHIFEPFFTTKKDSLGTGLGLATVEGMVRQSGGAIEAVSPPSEGTRVSIYLPRLTSANDANAEPPADDEKS